MNPVTGAVSYGVHGMSRGSKDVEVVLRKIGVIPDDPAATFHSHGGPFAEPASQVIRPHGTGARHSADLVQGHEPQTWVDVYGTHAVVHRGLRGDDDKIGTWSVAKSVGSVDGGADLRFAGKPGDDGNVNSYS